MGIEMTSKIKPVLANDMPEKEIVRLQDASVPEQNDEPRTEVTPAEIHRLVADLEHQIQQFNRRLKFEVNEELNRVVVKVIDRETDRIIKEIPSAEVQTLISRIRETLGILFDAEI